MNAIRVIGIGNETRGDDGAGLLVARLVRRAALPDVSVLELDGEPSALLDAWEDSACVYLADCCIGAGPPGALHRFAAHAHPLPADLGAVSSHGIGLGTTIELARALGALPRQLIVFAIAGAGFVPGTGPSAAVDCAARRAAQSICKEIGATQFPDGILPPVSSFIRR